MITITIEEVLQMYELGWCLRINDGKIAFEKEGNHEN